MREEIFRKKSLDKVKSPESLDDYIKVSNPGIWLLLIGVVVLLIGVCVWGIRESRQLYHPDIFSQKTLYFRL